MCRCIPLNQKTRLQPRSRFLRGTCMQLFVCCPQKALETNVLVAGYPVLAPEAPDIGPTRIGMLCGVWGRGVARGGGHTYKHLRTESILHEGHWKDAKDDYSKNVLVDEAWSTLHDRGVCRELWAEYNKWRGEAGRQSNIVVPEPPRATCSKWTAGHVPQMDPRAKGKGKGKDR